MGDLVQFACFQHFYLEFHLSVYLFVIQSSDNTYDDFRAKLGVVIGVVDCDTVPGKVKVDIVWEA